MGNNLRKQRERAEMTLRDLADKIVPPASFSMLQKLEKSGKPLPEKWKRRIAAALECHPDDLDSDEPAEVPIVGIVGAGAKIYPVDDHVLGFGFSEATPPRQLYSSTTIGVEVRGDSMEPLIRDGFVILYENRIFGVPEEYIGKVCVVQLVDDATYVKIIRKGTMLGRFNLESVNPAEDTITNAEVKWSAFVKGWLQR